MPEMHNSESDLEIERKRVEQLRLSVEAGDEEPKADDFAIIDGKYRVVRPYHFDFVFNVKQRHHNKNIIDIFTEEFPARTREYYIHAVLTGLTRLVHNSTSSLDQQLPCGTQLRHLVHRHEPVVSATPVTLVGNTPQYIAVNKPAGMPVHVAGQYRKNTVLGVLSAERPDLGPLHPVHRLDKPVSGVLIFARSPEAADTLRMGIADKGNVEKIYIARVMGRFPSASVGGGSGALPFASSLGARDGEKGSLGSDEKTAEVVVANVPLIWSAKTNNATPAPADEGMGVDGCEEHSERAATGAADAGEYQGNGSVHGTSLTVSKNKREVERGGSDADSDAGLTGRQLRKKKRRKKAKLTKTERIAANQARATASETQVTSPRPAVTEFKVIAVAPDGLTSLVECRPLTGRPHQIRAHLAWLGHPIANDIQYGGKYDGPTSCRALAVEMGVSWSAPGGGDGIVVPQPSGQSIKQERTIIDRPRSSPVSQEDASTIPENQVGKHENIKGRKETPGSNLLSLNSTDMCPRIEAPAELHDPHCPHCPFYNPKNYPTDLRPLWLHARRYASPDWEFEAPLPEWAGEEWTPPLPTTNR